MNSFQPLYYRDDSGAALLVVLSIVLILILFMGMLFQDLLQTHASYANEQRRVQLQYLAESGLNLTLGKLQSSNIPLDTETHWAIPDTVVVEFRPLGLYVRLLSHAFLNGDTSTAQAILGFQSDELFPAGLFLQSQIPVIVFSNGTTIQGDVYLNDLDIHYNPPKYEMQRPVKGNILNTDTLQFPELLHNLITSRFEQYEQMIRYPNRRLLTEYDPGTYHPEEFMHHDVYINGDVLLSADSVHSQDTQLRQLVVNGSVTLNNQGAYNNSFEIIARDEIVFQDSVQADKLICYSSSGITAQGSSQLGGQLLSPVHISISQNAIITFPSILCVQPLKEDKIPPANIQITEQAQVNAIIIAGYPFQEEESIETDRTALYEAMPHILHKSKQTMQGGLLAEGYVENYANLDGFLATFALRNVIGQTTWWNNLSNTVIQRDVLVPTAPIPPVFNRPGQLRILQIEPVASPLEPIL